MIFTCIILTVISLVLWVPSVPSIHSYLFICPLNEKNEERTQSEDKPLKYREKKRNKWKKSHKKEKWDMFLYPFPFCINRRWLILVFTKQHWTKSKYVFADKKRIAEKEINKERRSTCNRNEMHDEQSHLARHIRSDSVPYLLDTNKPIDFIATEITFYHDERVDLIRSFWYQKKNLIRSWIIMALCIAEADECQS